MLIHITHITPKKDFSMAIQFSDGVEKRIDFIPFIGTDNLSNQLKNYSYFSKVKIYENGRGIYWPNQFDFCPDYLYSLGS